MSFAAWSGHEAYPAREGRFCLPPQQGAPQSWSRFVQARRSRSIQPVTGIQAGGTKFLPLFNPRLSLPGVLPEHISLPKAVCRLAHWQSRPEAGRNVLCERGCCPLVRVPKVLAILRVTGLQSFTGLVEKSKHGGRLPCPYAGVPIRLQVISR